MRETISTISDAFVDTLHRIRTNYFLRNLVADLRILFNDPITRMSMYFLGFVFLLGVFGPIIAPYDPSTSQFADGQLLRTEPPSLSHPLGTNATGQDLLSRILVGARPTMLTALLVGIMIFIIGSAIGMTAGYLGGTVDEVLMRFTDFVYSVPVLIAAIVLVALLGGGFTITVFVIGLLLWRGMARVIRSQTLQIKEQPYVMAARSTGASSRRILVKHIFPSVAPMAILFTAIGAGYAILIEAGLAFLGVGDPGVPTWGVIIRNAHRAGAIDSAWWWSIIPGLLISFTVLSAFLIGRGYENIAEQDEGMVVA